MSIASALAAGRRAALARMGALNGGSDAIVRRITDRWTQDENTGLQIPIWDDIHVGPMRLAGAERGSSGARTEQVPGGEIQLGTRAAHFPASVTMLHDGDLIDITAGENVGTVWKILEADFADQQTARRLPVVSVQRPEEWA